MFKISKIFLLIAVLALVTGIKAQGNCPKNQQFTECGTACPPKCNDDDPLRPCTLQCIVGCQCKQGYLLNARHECVTPAEC